MTIATLRRPRVNAGAGGPSATRIAASHQASTPSRPTYATEESSSSTNTNESSGSSSSMGLGSTETDPTSMSEDAGLGGGRTTQIMGKDTDVATTAAATSSNLIDSPASSAPSSPTTLSGGNAASNATTLLAGEESLCQLVYTSSARDRYMARNELQTILSHSRKANASKGITGLLLFRDGTFAQFLEGPQQHVEALFERIQQDDRHRGVIVVLKRQGVRRRDFAEWRMAYRDLDQDLSRENADEDKGQVGRTSVKDEEKACLLDLTRIGEKDLTHHQMSSSIRTLIKVFHSSLGGAH